MRKTPTDRFLAHARRYCAALETMTTMRRDAANARCSRQEDCDYPDESVRCEQERGVGPDYEPFGSLDESKWCERCKAFKANAPKFRSAKATAKDALTSMRRAWRSEMKSVAPDGKKGGGA